MVSCSLTEFLSRAGILIPFLAVVYGHHKMMLPLRTQLQGKAWGETPTTVEADGCRVSGAVL